MTKTELWNTAPQAPDFIAAGKAMAEIVENAAAVQRGLAERALKPAEAPYDPSAALKTMTDFGLALWSNPLKLAQAQAETWRAFGEVAENTARRAMGEEIAPAVQPAKGDRRFKDSGWDQPGFDFLRQSYLVTAERLQQLVDGAEGLDEDTRVRASFLIRQFIAAISPTNFAATNPAVVRKTLETGGVNLLQGAAYALEDAAGGHGLVQRRPAESFEIGKTIAATPGAVVFRNDLMELIQYSPTTETVARRPVLMVPPMVNKYYLFDLQPRSSLLKWLVDQGQTVFVISWANPDEAHREKDLTAFVKEGVVEALRAIEQATGERAVDVTSFCMGGTLLAISLGYLQAIGEDDRVASATLIGALIDFTALGEWSGFMGERETEAFARYLSGKGYVEAKDLAKLFSVVRSNDLIWGPFVQHYLMGEQSPASDLLFWFDDAARMPEGLLNSYLKDVVRGNGLSRPGGVTIDGKPIDLKKVKTPIHFISMKEDHVSGWQATYKGLQMFGGPVTFTLGGSGHNAGVINPPAAGKHGYWTNPEKPASPDDWMAGAERHDGSWWPFWRAWATEGQEQVPARTPGDGKLPALEAAPGSYVRVRH
ncbi:MAG TPA: alpha/beta fold hydrolase [Caulobacteraceae bacterium]|jgi:polyhydroxyalkanoate synthase